MLFSYGSKLFAFSLPSNLTGLLRPKFYSIQSDDLMRLSRPLLEATRRTSQPGAWQNSQCSQGGVVCIVATPRYHVETWTPSSRTIFSLA